MNWQSVAFDWNQARAFLATVEEGSLSAGARALGLTQPTIGRQVAALESKLDVVLFEKVGRSLVLTAAGVELLEHVRSMYEAASKMSLAASGQSQTIEGQVRITASDVISAYVLPRALKKLRKIAPLVTIDVVATNNISDLLQREADIAIRHVRPEQPDLIARLVCKSTARFYASRDYLEQHGQPLSLAEMSEHAFIGSDDAPRTIEYFKSLGLPLTSKNLHLGSQSGIVTWEMARAGLGIVAMADEIASLDSDMQCVLPDMKPIEFPFWLTTHRELHTSARIRLVFDFLAEFLGKKIN